MGKREKKPLYLKNNYPVRTLEELQEYFDLQKIKEYYANDQLLQWLNERYYEEQAEKIANLKETGLNLDSELYSIFEINPEKIEQTTENKATQQNREEVKGKSYETATQKSIEEASYKVNKEKEEAEYKVREEALRLAKEKERKDTGLLFANCCIIGGVLSLFMLPLSFLSIIITIISIAAGICSKNLIAAKRSTFGILLAFLVLVYQIIGNIFTPSSNQTLVADVKKTETISEDTLSEIPLSTTENIPTEKATIPESIIPESATIESTQVTTAPETTVPETTTSETVTLETTTQATTAPETTVPETTIPETTTSETVTLETRSKQTNSSKIVGNQYTIGEYNRTVKLTINAMYFTRNLESIGIYDYLPDDSTAFIIEYTVNTVKGSSDIPGYKDSVALRAANNYTWYRYSQSLTDSLLEINNFESYFQQIDEHTLQYILAFTIPNEYTSGDFPLVLNLYGSTAIEFSASVVNVIP